MFFSDSDADFMIESVIVVYSLPQHCYQVLHVKFVECEFFDGGTCVSEGSGLEQMEAGNRR